MAAHIFSLFYSNLSKMLGTRTGGFIEFSDKDLAQRVLKILRLHNGETVTLFDRSINLDLEIKNQVSSNNKLCGSILRIDNNNQIIPEITLMPCILKRDAFEDVIYAAAQMAVTKIIPIISTKTHRSWSQDKETERLTNIMIAACEQSKNYVVPELHNPIKIEDLNHAIELHKADLKAYFDPAGQIFFNLLQDLHQKPCTNISMLFGPEGGLTCDEEKVVTDAGFKTYALTPTILRSREAVIVGLGGIRSVAK